MDKAFLVNILVEMFKDGNEDNAFDARSSEEGGRRIHADSFSSET